MEPSVLQRIRHLPLASAQHCILPAMLSMPPCAGLAAEDRQSVHPMEGECPQEEVVQ